MIFVIPWREFSLVGTTDTDFDGDLDRLHATRGRGGLPARRGAQALPDPRVAARASRVHLRGRAAAQLRGGPARVGRLARAQGRRARARRPLPLGHRHQAHVLPQPGRRGGRSGHARRSGAPRRAARRGSRSTAPTRTRARGSARVARRVRGRRGLAACAARRSSALVDTYGRGYRRVVELAGKVPGGTERLCPTNPEIVAQLHHAVHEEMAVSLQDVLLRRTGIGTSPCQGLDCAEAIGERMAQLCGWTPRRLEAELDAYERARRPLARVPPGVDSRALGPRSVRRFVDLAVTVHVL